MNKQEFEAYKQDILSAFHTFTLRNAARWKAERWSAAEIKPYLATVFRDTGAAVASMGGDEKAARSLAADFWNVVVANLTLVNVDHGFRTLREVSDEIARGWAKWEARK